MTVVSNHPCNYHLSVMYTMRETRSKFKAGVELTFSCYRVPSAGSLVNNITLIYNVKFYYVNLEYGDDVND